MTNGWDYEKEKAAADAVGIGNKLDFRLARKQAELLVDLLREEGRELAADVVSGLDSAMARAVRDADELREELAELRAGAKTSRGRDRASHAGTINNGGLAQHGVAGRGIAPPHKHEYGSEGICIKVTGGIPCTATRQRKARKPKGETVATEATSAEGTA